MSPVEARHSRSAFILQKSIPFSLFCTPTHRNIVWSYLNGHKSPQGCHSQSRAEWERVHRLWRRGIADKMISINKLITRKQLSETEFLYSCKYEMPCSVPRCKQPAYLAYLDAALPEYDPVLLCERHYQKKRLGAKLHGRT